MRVVRGLQQDLPGGGQHLRHQEERRHQHRPADLLREGGRGVQCPVPGGHLLLQLQQVSEGRDGKGKVV